MNHGDLNHESCHTNFGELYYKTKRQHLLYKCGYIGEYLWEQLLPQNDKELERFAIWHKMQRHSIRF